VSRRAPTEREREDRDLAAFARDAYRRIFEEPLLKPPRLRSIPGREPPGWLGAILALRPGQACEYRPRGDPTWRAGAVIENGGTGAWRVRDGDAEIEVELFQGVRCPGQVEAWA